MDKINLDNFKAKVNEAFITNTSEAAGFLTLEMVKELLLQGFERKDIINALNYFREKFETEKKEDASDYILSIMDSLTGWCSPDQML
jgi:hypothetical protein